MVAIFAFHALYPLAMLGANRANAALHAALNQALHAALEGLEVRVVEDTEG